MAPSETHVRLFPGQGWGEVPDFDKQVGTLTADEMWAALHVQAVPQFDAFLAACPLRMEFDNGLFVKCSPILGTINQICVD